MNYEKDELYKIVGGTNDMDDETFFAKFDKPVLSIPSYYVLYPDEKYPSVENVDRLNHLSYCSESQCFYVNTIIEQEYHADSINLVIEPSIIRSLFHPKFNPIKETQVAWINEVDSIITSFPEKTMSQIIINYLIMSPLRFHQQNVFEYKTPIPRNAVNLLWQNSGTQIRMTKQGEQKYICFRSTETIQQMGSWSMSVMSGVSSPLRFGIYDNIQDPAVYRDFGFLLQRTYSPLQFRFRYDSVKKVVSLETDLSICHLENNNIDLSEYEPGDPLYFYVDLSANQIVSVP
jgi:hypothetical protein